MKLIRFLPLLSFVLLLACGALVLAAEVPATAAGYWEGAVTLPNGELGIRVELTGGTGLSWNGTIDIPLQGLRGFKLDPVAIDGANVTFALPGIPGDPRFTGKLAADANTITGEFSQGGGTMEFRLERKVKPAQKPIDETPASGVPGKGLAGHWRGSLKPMPQVELRLALNVTQTATGKPEGYVVSLDQGNARIPITTLTETGGAVHFETASVGGEFEGKFNTDGSEIVGDWSQGGRNTPLVFKRVLKATGANDPTERP
jgi:hypothetical protein